MPREVTVTDYVGGHAAAVSEEEVCLRINLDSAQKAGEYGCCFKQVTTLNPKNITQLVIYGQFDDQDSYGFSELISTILQNCSKLTNVRMLEINSVKLDQSLANLLYKVVGTLEQRMLLNTLRVLYCQLGSQLTLQLIMALKANTNLHCLDISSNFCGDSIFPLLLENMTKFEQNINSLSFCHNNLSDQGMQQIAAILSSQKVFVRELYLSHNSKLTADAVTDLLVCVMRCNHLQTLSLAGCNLQHAYWARYLPFIRSLHSLDLAHNCLDDDALIVLGNCLRTNTSLTSLNLSHNRFISYGGHIFESVFADNACLQVLSLACNPFRDKSVWKSVALGLSMNNVLISLDLSDTGLTTEDLELVGSIAFMNNTTLRHINLEDNFLPFSISHMDSIFPENDIREFLQDAYPASCSSILPLSESAEADSANASLTWIAELRTKIQASIEVNAIVDAHSGELRTASDASPNSEDINSADDFERKMYSPEIVQHSSYYLSPTQLNDEIVRDMQELYSALFAHLVYVCWGRKDFVLGALDIDVHLSYAQLRPLVLPFVANYMSTVLDTDQLQFSILSAGGDVTDQSSYYQNRSVWADVRHVQPAPTVILRPSNWIKLDD